MQDQIAKLKTDISVLIKQNDMKINTLVRVRLQELEELKRENLILKQELVSKFKCHCNLCEYKSPEYTSLRFHENREQEGKHLLMSGNKVFENENWIVEQTTEIEVAS